MTHPDAASRPDAPPAPRASAEAADVLGALRHATAARHAVLDAAMPLARPAPALPDYVDHLRLLRAWLAPIESVLAGFRDGPQDPDRFPRAERLGLIDADLAAAHAGRESGNVAPLTGGVALRMPPQPAYRWGVCYVIEGSQLGGAVLYRKLAASLAPHPLRYLSGDGQPPGPRWQHFLRALRDEVRTEADIALACQGACDAFDSILAMVKPHERG